MGEVTELVQGTIEKLLTRIDALAQKLGIAAEQIWKFTVTAKVVEAKRDVAKNLALAILPFFLWGWGLHVATMNLPHEIETTMSMEQTQTPYPCTQAQVVEGKIVNFQTTCMTVNSKPVEMKSDKGLSGNAYAYVVTGAVFSILGFVFMGIAIAGLIDGLAAIRTAECDAFQDLLYDLKD